MSRRNREGIAPDSFAARSLLPGALKAEKSPQEQKDQDKNRVAGAQTLKALGFPAEEAERIAKDARTPNLPPPSAKRK